MKINVVENVSDYFAQKLDYDETSYQKFRYGFSILYLTLTKTIALILIALVLGILSEMLILLCSYSFIRMFAFGIHLQSSTKCTVIGTLLFLCGTYLGIYVDFNAISYTVIFLISLIICIRYAPMPTVKRPIGCRSRRKFKLLSILSILVLFVLVFYFRHGLISNLIVIGILLEMLNILPVSSRILEKI